MAMTAIPSSLEFGMKNSIGGSSGKSQIGVPTDLCPLISDPCRHGAAATAIAPTGSVPVAEVKAESSLPAVVASKV